MVTVRQKVRDSHLQKSVDLCRLFRNPPLRDIIRFHEDSRRLSTIKLSFMDLFCVKDQISTLDISKRFKGFVMSTS